MRYVQTDKMCWTNGSIHNIQDQTLGPAEHRAYSFFATVILSTFKYVKLILKDTCDVEPLKLAVQNLPTGSWNETENRDIQISLVYR